MKFATKKAFAKKTTSKKTASPAKVKLDAMTASREETVPQPDLMVGLILEEMTKKLVRVTSTGDPIRYDPADLLSLSFNSDKVGLDDTLFKIFLRNLRVAYGPRISGLIVTKIEIDARTVIGDIVDLLENWIANPEMGV